MATEGLRQQVTEALLDYYGTNNVHPDDKSDLDDLSDVVLKLIEARDKARAEKFKRLAEHLWLKSESGELLSYSVGIREGQAKAYMQAAQMLVGEEPEMPYCEQQGFDYKFTYCKYPNCTCKSSYVLKFRRLAAEARSRTQMAIVYHSTQNTDEGQAQAWEQAAQMLEEELS